jgi:proliferating cell nuclear antigen
MAETETETETETEPESDMQIDILIDNSAKVDAFTTLFQSLKSFSEHTNVQFDNERMYIQTMDSARISILEISLPTKWFCKYKCDQTVVLGINASVMYKILSSKDKNQSIRLQYKSGEDKLNIHMCSQEGTTNAGFDRYFEAPLMDIESEYMAIPEIEYQMEMSLPSSIFSTLIHQLRGFGESLDIHCNEDNIRFTANTQESGSMSVDIRMDDLIEFSIEEECQLDMSFGLQFLQPVCSYSKISKTVNVKIHSDYPIRIEYPLHLVGTTPEIECGFIHFFLAPKIKDE